MDNPFNSRHYLDSRDVIAWRDYLADQIALHEMPEDEDVEGPEMGLVEADEELGAVEEFIEDASYSPDWEYGETIIEDVDFVDYAKELAEDLSDMREHGWPFCHIDWDQAAGDLRRDYTEATYRGRTFLIRA